jgi:hypothetical protein
MAAHVFGFLWSMTHIAGGVFVIDKESHYFHHRRKIRRAALARG